MFMLPASPPQNVAARERDRNSSVNRARRSRERSMGTQVAGRMNPVLIHDHARSTDNQVE
jgi:hypothetical protein